MHVSGRHVDLNLLIVLEAIVSAGGVTAASQRLHLTQPAVSHALARMVRSK
jgi:DNA-binding transcriptional LysR family regulator